MKSDNFYRSRYEGKKMKQTYQALLKAYHILKRAYRDVHMSDPIAAEMLCSAYLHVKRQAAEVLKGA